MTPERGWILRIRNLRTDQWDEILEKPLESLPAVQALAVNMLQAGESPAYPVELLGGFDFVEVERRPSFDGPSTWVPVRELLDPAGYPVAEEG